jgi:hypothetical protein
VIGALAVVLALVAAGCGSSQSSSSPAAGGAAGPTSTNHIEHAKTKFAFHAGLAFGAFHHFIYKPVKAGDLRHPFSHKLTLVKAGLAALFVKHELSLALRDAQADPALSKLVSPITALQTKIAALRGINTGSANPADVTQANGSIGSIKQGSASAGQPVSEHVPSSPSG